MVQHKPTDVLQDMSALREYAHEIQNTSSYTRVRARGGEERNESVPRKGNGKARERKERNDQLSEATVAVWVREERSVHI